MAELSTIQHLAQVRTPGLYELAPELLAPAELRTDTTAFLGLCAEGGPLEPTLVESWDEFLQRFGAPGQGRLLPQAVHAYFVNGGRRAVIVRADETGGDPDREAVLGGLEALEAYDGLQQTAPVSLICAPDLLHVEDHEPPKPLDEQAQVAEDLRFQTECLPTGSRRTEATPSRYPKLARPVALSELIPALQRLRAFAERGRRVALIDLPPALDSQGLEALRAALASPRVALYAPWILASPAEDPTGERRRYPPCGAVAGRIASSGLLRGPWRAPANLPVLGGIGLYRDPYLPSPAILFERRVNLIRDTPQGPTLLGARTTADEDERAWLHLGTRRLVDWLCGQLALDLRWAPFEPQGPRLYRKLLLTVNRRLDALYQAHALAGASRRDACFARCDASLNGREAQDAGRVVVEIGIAPAVPAEFIVFRLGLLKDGALEVLDA